VNGVRCFVAADLPAAVRDDLGRLQGRLRNRGVDCRWVSPEAMHLTLKFFGHLPVETFAEVCEALAEPLKLGAPARLVPAGVGAFASPRRARVIWAGLEGDVAILARAALALEARAESLGIPRETRPFRAHLTLGRAREREGIRGCERALEAEGSYRGPAFAVDELVLYESRLRPQGPEYVRRLTITL